MVPANYRLSSSREIHSYSCDPEIVVFDFLSKETMLFSSFSAAVIQLFRMEFDKTVISLDELKQESLQYCNDNIDGFEGCLTQLLQMNIIELVE